MKNDSPLNDNNSTESYTSVRDQLWPDEPVSEPWKHNPQWNDLPLSYKLWPDEKWPPDQLLDLSYSPAVRNERDRLFTEYYQREKNNWD